MRARLMVQLNQPGRESGKSLPAHNGLAHEHLNGRFPDDCRRWTAGGGVLDGDSVTEL